MIALVAGLSLVACNRSNEPSMAEPFRLVGKVYVNTDANNVGTHKEERISFSKDKFTYTIDYVTDIQDLAIQNLHVAQITIRGTYVYTEDKINLEVEDASIFSHIDKTTKSLGVVKLAFTLDESKELLTVDMENEEGLQGQKVFHLLKNKGH